MEMVLGNNVVRAALRSDLADRSPAGLEMHVAMANPIGRPDAQGRVRVRATTEAFDELLAWCAGSSRVVVGAPAAEKVAAAAAGRTQRRISVELERLARHPGYREVAMVGTETVVLPARRCGKGRWWPTRRMALSHGDGTTLEVTETLLVPSQVVRNGRVFTVWEQDPTAAEVPPGIWA